MHIWVRKEIENYLLVPSAICRVIAARAPRRTAPTEAAVAAKINNIIEQLRNEITDGYAHELQKKNRGWQLPTANSRARTIVSSFWQTEQGRLSVAPGKKVLSALSAWSKAEFDVSFGTEAIAQGIHQHELDSEVRAIIAAINDREPFPPPPPQPSVHEE